MNRNNYKRPEFFPTGDTQPHKKLTEDYNQENGINNDISGILSETWATDLSCTTIGTWGRYSYVEGVRILGDGMMKLMRPMMGGELGGDASSAAKYIELRIKETQTLVKSKEIKTRQGSAMIDFWKAVSHFLALYTQMESLKENEEIARKGAKLLCNLAKGAGEDFEYLDGCLVMVFTLQKCLKVLITEGVMNQKVVPFTDI